MNDISGIININKPSGVTSFWAVKQVRRILGVKKVGHCGTLDPLANGVLVVLVGKSTKLQDTLMAGKKTYRVILKLGVTTDTGDVTGTTLKESRVDADGLLKLDDILNSFKGEIGQMPPMYSALKYGGKRLYELARQGLEVKRELARSHYLFYRHVIEKRVQYRLKGRVLKRHIHKNPSGRYRCKTRSAARR